MPNTVSAFRWVPEFAQGLARDLRVRWALEEAGLPYKAALIGPAEQRSKDYRSKQPFGQVPTFEDDEVALFESAAIVHHIATKSPVLMPQDSAGQARMLTWMFAALNTIEPYVAEVAVIDLFHAKEQWAKERRPGAVQLAQARLDALATWMKDRDYLEDRFTAADLLMTTVLRLLRHTDIVSSMPVLEAYRLRCEARPAFKKALAAQMADFAESPAA